MPAWQWLALIAAAAGGVYLYQQRRASGLRSTWLDEHTATSFAAMDRDARIAFLLTDHGIAWAGRYFGDTPKSEILAWEPLTPA